MTKQRSYDDGCAAAHALDLVGDRWALLVVRELVLGPKRFTDLRVGLPNASPNVLAQRLRELEGSGIVRRRKLPPPAASRIYELTEWGMGLEQILISLGRWGASSPSKPQDAAIGIDSLVLSFRTMFDADAAQGLKATYELHFGDDVFHAEVGEGGFGISRGAAEGPDATVRADSNALAGVVYGGRTLEDAVRSGDIKVEGSDEAVARFVRLFPLPAKASPAVA